LCRNYCDEYYYFEDKTFPADPSSLASREIPDKWESSSLKGLDYYGVKEKVAWCRPSEFLDEWVNKQKDATNTEANTTTEKPPKSELKSSWALFIVMKLMNSDNNLKKCNK